MKKLLFLIILFTLFFGCEKENQPPVCKIISPANNALFYRGDTITLEIEASDPDGTIHEIRIYVDDIAITSLNRFPFLYEWETVNESAGIHKFKAIAIDKTGLEAISEVEVILELSVPIVITTAIGYITPSSATLGGNVTDDRGYLITNRGVCWSTSSDPDTSDFKIETTGRLGSYNSVVSGLLQDTQYYVRAYAINSEGIAYGKEKSFKTLIRETGTVLDIEGNIYQTVKIGDQWWMAENLKSKKYANGDTITSGIGVEDLWKEINPKYWFAYDDDLNNIPTYGVLYTWYTVMDSRDICPEGWHVPTLSDWRTLESTLFGSSVAGGKLKEVGTLHWNSPNTGATNESGFTALPAGLRDGDSYYHLGTIAAFWSSTMDINNEKWVAGMTSYSSKFLLNKGTPGNVGISIRCIKD